MAKRHRTLLYFFVNEQLHRRIGLNKPKDLLTAWNYPEHRVITYTYSDVINRYERAFNHWQVAKLLNRSNRTIEGDILKQVSTKPQLTYSLDGRNRPGRYYWSESNVLDYHDYLVSVHYGRPRRDGAVRPNKKLPSRRELRALMHETDDGFYTKQGDMYVPTWRTRN